jgi:hypothetical protein
MGPFAVGGIVFVSLFGGAILGTTLGAALPAHHLSCDSKDAIKLATAIVATLSALVPGLLVASAKTSFDTAVTGREKVTAMHNQGEYPRLANTKPSYSMKMGISP